MPALLILAVISWLFGTGKTRTKATNDLRLFTALEERPQKRWSAFFASVAAHVVFVCLILIVSDIFSTPNDEYHPRNMARSVVIRLPDNIYLASASSRNAPSSPRQPQEQRVRVRRKDLRKYAESLPEPKSILPPSPLLADTERSLLSMMTPPPPAQAEPRKFELPDLPVKVTAMQTLLQPDQPPDVAPQLDKRLPQLVLWGAGKQDLKPPPEPVQPGNRTARIEAPKLNSTPRLEAPNLETLTSDLRITSSTSAIQSILNLPPATAMPVRALEPSNKEPSAPGSIDPFTGQPVHVLALSADPAPLTDAFKSLLIPAGNQLGRLPGTAPFFGLPGLGDGSASSRTAAADNGSTDGADGAPGGEPGHSSGDGSAVGLVMPPGFTGTPLRILHPNNGVFDIVVVQSSAIGSFPDGAQALSGRPIYTVYLQVGAPKEWILQYCVPNSTGPVQTGNLVDLGNPAPIGAPYPMVTVRPPEDWRHGADYLLVHGFLDASGRFRDLQVLSNQEPSAATTGALLQYLAYWEFRPAVQDGRPVMVEVILAVPPDQVS
jgi:hypothetical protein